MKKTLYLMRHAQTLFNSRKKIQGACDSPLTELGIKQAKVAKQYFKENNIIIDFAYSSTQERASDTLEIVTDNMPYTRLKGIKEWNFGIFEGEPDYLIPKLDGQQSFGEYFVSYGGESHSQVEKRTNDTLTEIMEKEDHNNVLAVSHGGSCYTFLLKWAKPEQITTDVGNCCIFKYEYENGKFTLVELINHDFDNLIK